MLELYGQAIGRIQGLAGQSRRRDEAYILRSDGMSDWNGYADATALVGNQFKHAKIYDKDGKAVPDPATFTSFDAHIFTCVSTSTPTVAGSTRDVLDEVVDWKRPHEIVFRHNFGGDQFYTNVLKSRDTIEQGTPPLPRPRLGRNAAAAAAAPIDIAGPVAGSRWTKTHFDNMKAEPCIKIIRAATSNYKLTTKKEAVPQFLEAQDRFYSANNIPDAGPGPNPFCSILQATTFANTSSSKNENTPPAAAINSCGHRMEIVLLGIQSRVASERASARAAETSSTPAAGSRSGGGSASAASLAAAAAAAAVDAASAAGNNAASKRYPNLFRSNIWKNWFPAGWLEGGGSLGSPKVSSITASIRRADGAVTPRHPSYMIWALLRGLPASDPLKNTGSIADFVDDGDPVFPEPGSLCLFKDRIANLNAKMKTRTRDAVPIATVLTAVLGGLKEAEEDGGDTPLAEPAFLRTVQCQTADHVASAWVTVPAAEAKPPTPSCALGTKAVAAYCYNFISQKSRWTHPYY